MMGGAKREKKEKREGRKGKAEGGFSFHSSLVCVWV